eukprot:c21258_g1_i1 orf=207-1235(-)
MGSENLRPLLRRRSKQDESKCQTFVILPHIIAEAMSSLHGLDLRWSGPITPTEMRYVEQYVQARYPEYYCLLGSIDKENLPVGFTIVKEDGETIDYGSCSSSGSQTEDSPRNSLRFSPASRDFSSCFGKSLSDLNRTQLEEMSKLVELLTKRVSSSDNSLSIPEMHARNKVLNHCGASEADYIVVFSTGTKEALQLVGESYPFQRYTYYMTILEEEIDCIRKFATHKEAKVIAAPASWLDLRIAGSQLSQHFRKKSKHIPKGLFAYAADIGGSRNSLHWVSEAQRNHWHVLLNCAELVLGVDQLNLTMHKPDFVLFTLPKKVNHPTKITCLLVRRNSFILSN